MAKNNLFLGMAAGSVGDVTFYRRNGAQISRARNRNPKNPKSTGQATQRAFFAPVARFYAPLAQVLETSYEGLSRSASYSKFLSDNVKAARTNGWYVPKGAPFWPLPYTLSKGTLQPIAVERAGSDRFMFWSPGDTELYGAPKGSVGQLSRSMVAAGYKDGDQVTVITVHPDGVGGYYPAWIRFNLNIDSFEQASAVVKNSAIYVNYEDQSGTGQWFINPQDDEGEGVLVAAAVIISRYENGIWRRSTQSLVLTEEAEATITGAEAIRRAIDSYRSSQGVPVSDIYLNGGTSNDSGLRYVGGITIDNTAAGLVPSYLSTIGRDSFAIDAQGTTSQLLTVSGVAVATGEVISNAAVCVGVTTNEGVVTGHFVGVTNEGAAVTYSPVAVTGRDLVQAILPKCDVYVESDQYQMNARNFLLAQGVPESALDFQ